MKLPITHGYIRVSFKTIGMVLTALLVLAALAGCGLVGGKTGGTEAVSQGVVNPFPSFRDVPGITLGEIAAIEKLQKERTSFIFGANETTDTFLMENGEAGGFTTMFCEYLSEFFGIPFQHGVYSWNDLLEKTTDGTIDFMAGLTANEERRRTFFMTEPVAERQLKMMRLRGSPSLERIAQGRLPRYALIRTSVITNMVVAATKPGTFEPVYVADINEAYQEMLAGNADVCFGGSVTIDYNPAPDVYTEDFFPLLFTPVSLTTANPDLAPIISVMDKALKNGASHYINHLNNLGFEAYKIERFRSQLTREERVYLRNTSTVPLVARYFNYPVAFFNSYEHEWEGIIFDVLAEVEKFTGLKFEVTNDEHTEYIDLVEMLYNGRAHIFADLPNFGSQAGRFLWGQNTFLSNQFALLSKAEYPNVSLNEIANARVGLIENTVHAEMFRAWFPSASNTRECATIDYGFLALERGEVDLIMTSKNRLLSFLNYYGLSNYKANYLFNFSETGFVFNKDQATLCSIIDKALPLINTNTIVEQWMTKTYDYQKRLMEAQRPWLYGAIALSLTVLTMVLVLLIRGLGARKRLAKLVAEETSTLTAILDGTPDHLFVKDLNRRYTRCNKNMAIYHKINREDILGKTDVEAFKIPLEVSSNLQAIEDKVFSEKQLQISEEVIPAPDGKVLLFETIRTPLIHDGEVTGLVGMARDITQRKATEEEAKKASAEAMLAYAEAENASQAKSRFIANMSHEIRTPMNAILGITEIILRNENLPPDVVEALYKIYNSGDLLLYIINDILDLSKIEAGKLEILPAQYDAASMINDTVMLNVMRIGSKPIEFKLSVDENIPSHLIGDELRIRQVLNNVISNAIKYTFKGEVKLTVYAEKRSADSIKDAASGEDTVAIMYSVSDTGQGMSQEQVNKMFDEYSRFNADANRTTEGAGLGMSITQNLVRMMKGNICVESEPDKGTTVTVRLPQLRFGSGILGKELAGNLAKFEKSAIKHIKKAQIVFEPMPYGSILLVDDVESNLFVAEGLMVPYGLSIESVLSGFEAIDKIKEGKTYDIVFMDHMMPKMDGIETTKKIRELGYTQPIVALTANAIVGQSNIFMENGFDGFISKPIDIRQLNATLKKFVRDKQSPEVIEAAIRNKGERKSGRVYTREQLAEIFVRDASRLAKTLEELQETKAYSDDDIRTYTITTHALKSALNNVGEIDLSAVASKLEDIGRANDVAVMKAETPKFLDDLRAVIEKNTPRQEEGREPVVEDRAYLQEKLLVIKNACEAYDRKTIRAALTDLRQKEWQSDTKELLASMDENLLNGDFEAVSKAAGI
jgi:PAS domain S-box-containing protein